MEYDPSHKASSITSTSSGTSSIWDPVPSLYSGKANSVSSAYDLDDLLLDDGKEVSFDKLDPIEDDDSHLTKKEKLLKPSCKELLSDQQKKANHIASEQKRRNTIRGGFKELTELVPTLKNINNSKSIILFKSVEYVNQLNRRNKQLAETLAMLQRKVKQKQLMKKKSMSYHSISIPSDIVNTAYNAPALVMPASVDDWLIDQSYSTPSFIIPAVESDNLMIHGRERLLSSGKLNHLKNKEFYS
ncbi:hypothetical protein BY458DRAFT_496148 [Sporodiniella umbellata]|nr:hypothetical protein BY458DRAFT_496148 [Sporodiniella umbellata]